MHGSGILGSVGDHRLLVETGEAPVSTLSLRMNVRQPPSGVKLGN